VKLTFEYPLKTEILMGRLVDDAGCFGSMKFVNCCFTSEKDLHYLNTGNMDYFVVFLFDQNIISRFVE